MIRSHRPRLAFVASLWGLGLALLFAPASASDTKTTEGAMPGVPADLVASGSAPDLFLLHTGEVIGYLETCGCKRNPAGGLARRSWVVNEIERLFPGTPLLLLDSGSFTDNPTAEGDVRTKALLEGMKRIGYQVVNVGERDVRMGYEPFLGLTSGTPFRFLSSNLVRQDGERPVFKPRTVVDAVSPDGKKKLRVGVIGALRHNPTFLQPGPEGSQIVTVDPIPRVKAEVEALGKEKVALVVLLAAMHKDDAKRLAEQVPGIDFILGSFGGQFTAASERVNDTTMMYVGNQGKRLVELRVFLDEGKTDVVNQSVKAHNLTSLYPPDPKMDEFVKAAAPPAPASASAAPGPAAE